MVTSACLLYKSISCTSHPHPSKLFKFTCYSALQAHTQSQKNNLKKNERTYRDGIPKNQSNEVGTNDTTVPLRTPIPISFDFFPTRSYACDRMLDLDVYILWQFFESTLV